MLTLLKKKTHNNEDVQTFFLSMKTLVIALTTTDSHTYRGRSNTSDYNCHLKYQSGSKTMKTIHSYKSQGAAILNSETEFLLGVLTVVRRPRGEIRGKGACC